MNTLIVYDVRGLGQLNGRVVCVQRPTRAVCSTYKPGFVRSSLT